MPRPKTRTRILLTSLQLFNEKGEPNTTTNEIADVADISPGNLHYHFRKKADLIDALLAEFQADSRRLLVAPEDDADAVAAFWDFVHLLLEILVAYRFLFRDTETLRAAYPQVDRAMRGFARGLNGATELHVRSLRDRGLLALEEREIANVCSNVVVVAVYAERFDALAGNTLAPDATALRIARSVLSLILPYATAESAPLLQALTEQYRR